MQRMTKLLLPLCVSGLLLQADTTIDSIGINTGTSTLNYKQKDTKGTVELEKPLEESFKHVEVFALMNGVFEDTTLKPTFNYIYTSNESFTNNILAFGVNKYIVYNKFSIYGGVLAGVGYLKWKTDAIVNAKDIDTVAFSLLAIAQVGVEYPINKDIYLGINVKYYLSDYETKLEPTNLNHATISHKNGNLISLGLRYKF